MAVRPASAARRGASRGRANRECNPLDGEIMLLMIDNYYMVSPVSACFRVLP